MSSSAASRAAPTATRSRSSILPASARRTSPPPRSPTRGRSPPTRVRPFRSTCRLLAPSANRGHVLLRHPARVAPPSHRIRGVGLRRIHERSAAAELLRERDDHLAARIDLEALGILGNDLAASRLVRLLLPICFLDLGAQWCCGYDPLLELGANGVVLVSRNHYRRENA